jgi:hypothetical protein
MAISDIALNEADEINNDQTNFESLRRIFRDEQSKKIGAGLTQWKSEAGDNLTEIAI